MADYTTTSEEKQICQNSEVRVTSCHQRINKQLLELLSEKDRKRKVKKWWEKQSYPCGSMSSLSMVGEACTISSFSSPISSANESISCRKTECEALTDDGMPKEEEEE